MIESQNDGYALCGFTVPDFTGHPPSHHAWGHGNTCVLLWKISSLNNNIYIHYNTLHPDFPAFFAAVLVVARLETKCSWEPVSCYQHTSAQSSVGRGAVNISCSERRRDQFVGGWSRTMGLVSVSWHAAPTLTTITAARHTSDFYSWNYRPKIVDSQTEIYCCCRRVESVSCSEESSQHGAGVQPRQSQHGAHQLGPQEDKCVNESSRNKIFREGTQKHIHTWNY